MSSTQGNLVLVLMGATAAAPWAALALESRTVRSTLARRKARRTLRAAGFRPVPGKSQVPAPLLGFPRNATVTPTVAPADEVFASVGAVIALADQPPELVA